MDIYTLLGFVLGFILGGLGTFFLFGRAIDGLVGTALGLIFGRKDS